MDFWPKIVYQDDYIFLSRKPHGIASSWGDKESFLSIIKKHNFNDNLWSNQISIFWEEWEYGLLNRLDNVTAWLLYFAKSYEAKAEYMHLQDQWWIVKTYYAQVYGIPKAQFGRITSPIYHHHDDASRMTIDPVKGRGKAQEVVTYREKMHSHSSWINSNKFCRLKIQITSGCRHQIRCHLASIGNPIVGDRLYMSKWLKKIYPDYNRYKIDLMSVGLQINERHNI